MADEPWHLSKSIPITFILAIVAQTIALIFFVATLRNDVDNNARDLLRQSSRITAIEATVQNQSVLLGRIDENIQFIKEALQRDRQ